LTLAIYYLTFYFYLVNCYNKLVSVKKILKQLNIPAQCKKYGISLWQCPSFLFLIMGFIIIAASIIFYFLGMHYIDDPATVVFFVLILAALLFCLAYIITNSFENLVEASRMKTEFINIVSHQLRTPLSSLRWAIELLISGNLGKVGEGQEEYFRIIKENISRINNLISELLTISRIESARFPLREEFFSLVEVVKELIAEFEPFAKASNVEIKFNFEEKLPKAFADREKIKRTIENLLDNAIRYIGDKGKVEIKVLKKNKFIYFEIKDNGVGIPKKDQKYIFEKFFRSENALRYQTQGSGLGLYIARAIIEKSGGRIGFQSKEGKGTTFWFILPIKKETKAKSA